MTTDDFLASFFPQRMSYAERPDAAALEATVGDLGTEADRAGRPALWLLYDNNAGQALDYAGRPASWLLYDNNAGQILDHAGRPALAGTAQARSSPGASAGSSGTPPDQTASGAGGG